MKHRLSILFIVILIGFNGLTFFDEQSKKSVQGKIAFALDYYRERAWFYYRRFTGQIPPDIIMKNHWEWTHFSPVCDALILNNSQSIDWFKLYLESRDEALKKVAEIENDGWNPPNSQSPSSPPPRRRFPFEQMQRDIFTGFQQKIKSQLTEKELAMVEQIFSTPWMDPDADLQALRFLALNENQRAELKPFAMGVVQARLTARPWFPNSRRPRFDENVDENDAAIKTAKKILIEKTKEILTTKQVEKWIVKRDAIQKTIDEEREWDFSRRLSYQRRPDSPNDRPDPKMSRNRQAMPQYLPR